jgi:hypothetical protein
VIVAMYDHRKVTVAAIRTLEAEPAAAGQGSQGNDR